MNFSSINQLQAELRRCLPSLKPVAFQILGIPLVMVIMCAALLGLLASLYGLSGPEFALDFVFEAYLTIGIVQAKMLLVVGSVGAFCFFLGNYHIDVLASYVADKLQSKIKGLTLFWASMLASGRTLFLLSTAPAVRVPAEALDTGVRAGFVPGDTPQRE